MPDIKSFSRYNAKVVLIKLEHHQLSDQLRACGRETSSETLSATLDYELN
jgi:hypothetical protein